jgi:hypothetical protein
MKIFLGQYSTTAVWLLLCGLTLFSLAFFESSAWRWSSSILTVLIAAAKARLVIVSFMETKQALPHWRLLFEVWYFAAATTIIIGYALSLSPSPH